MRLKRILAIPFTLAADVATLGNMGDRSFTQQLFDAERREQEDREAMRALEMLLKARRGEG